MSNSSENETKNEPKKWYSYPLMQAGLALTVLGILIGVADSPSDPKILWIFTGPGIALMLIHALMKAAKDYR